MSKTLKSIIGGSSNVVYEQIIGDSQVWKPTYDSEVVIYVVGAGGSGAAIYSTGASAACGGGAGEVALLRTRLYADTAYTVTIGAGGSTVSAGTGNPNTPVAGKAGGSTSFVGGGINVTANGGQGGNAALATSGVPATANGGAGGTGGTGGTFHYAGGRGGNVSCTTAATVAVRLVTGGGGINLLNTSNTRGGDIDFVADPAASTTITTGGGGVFGHGGDSTNETIKSTQGGTGFRSGETNLNAVTDPGVGADIYGIINNCLSSSTRGAGSRGGTVGTTTVATATAFAGGGAGSANNVKAGAGLLGGGGGGAIDVSATGTSGAGGNGFVLIQYLEAVGA